MEPFGRLLKRLRERRGLTQSDLAELASVSLPTIYRGEKSATCEWRRSARVHVMRALDRAKPLAQSDAKAYMEATGLDVLRRASEALSSLGGPTPRIEIEEIDEDSARDPDHLTAHAFLNSLIEDRGAKNIVTALEGLAAAWAIDLPPRIRADDITAGTAPRLILVHPPRRIEDREVTVYEPAPTPANPPTKGKTPHKRKTA